MCNWFLKPTDQQYVQTLSVWVGLAASCWFGTIGYVDNKKSNENTERKIQRAETSLLRKLNWISRHDTRIAFVTSISIAMLGVLARTSATIAQWNASLYVVFGLTVLLLSTCLALIYCSQYPKTESRNLSLSFFGTIAPMKLDEFQKRFKERSEEEYLDDLLCQIHINAEILSKKFHYLKWALISLATSIVPWLLALYLSKLFIK